MASQGHLRGNRTLSVVCGVSTLRQREANTPPTTLLNCRRRRGMQLLEANVSRFKLSARSVAAERYIQFPRCGTAGTRGGSVDSPAVRTVSIHSSIRATVPREFFLIRSISPSPHCQACPSPVSKALLRCAVNGRRHASRPDLVWIARCANCARTPREEAGQVAESGGTEAG